MIELWMVKKDWIVMELWMVKKDWIAMELWILGMDEVEIKSFRLQIHFGAQTL